MHVAIAQRFLGALFKIGYDNGIYVLLLHSLHGYKPELTPTQQTPAIA
jgi:hypothetical protein